MASQVRRYVAAGPSEAALASQVPIGTSIVVATVVPRAEVDVTIDPDTSATDLDFAMDALGWSFSESAPPAPTALAIRQSQASKLTTTGSSIGVALGWTDVLSVTISSKGASRLVVVSSLIATVSIGGEVRTLINGGSFSNEELYEPISLPLLSSGTVAPCTTYVDLPSTVNRTSYDIKLQARGVGILAAVTPRKGAALLAIEYGQ